MTTQEDIRRWLNEGKRQGATHVLVVCDTFDWGDYPVYVMGNIKERAKEFDGVNMQKIMECYDLSLDWESQIKEPRARHGI